MKKEKKKKLRAVVPWVQRQVLCEVCRTAVSGRSRMWVWCSEHDEVDLVHRHCVELWECTPLLLRRG